MKTSEKRAILKSARRGIMRPRDVRSVPRAHLRKLVEDGDLWQPGRGLYLSVDAPISENQSLAEVAALSPRAVIGLLSALRFHDLTTENPSSVYVLLPRGARAPKLQHLNIIESWVSGDSYSSGIEEHMISGVMVRVTSPAKTVADCFKFRNETGLNVAIEALKDAWRKKKATSDELWRYSRICRMENVMRPYLASVIE